jgi:tetratricopeptide (TPR) repeat protein
MGWLSASALSGPLDAPSDSLELHEHLHWTGRYGDRQHLEDLATRLRPTEQWSAQMALALSVGWLLAGDGRAADRAYLEADRLDPSLRLLPDPWGLWRSTPPSDAEAPEPVRPGPEAQLVATFHRWRWLEPEDLLSQWHEHASADWRWALTPEGLDGLALLVRQRQALTQPLEPFLVQMVPEEEIAADPGQALRFWGFLCDLWPDWAYARLKAAELALTRGQHGQAGLWLEQAPEADHANAWHWDLRARQALATGEPRQALDHWGEAVRRALAGDQGLPDGEAEKLAELFRQRRREARRGPALLEARSLLERGQVAEARHLLEHLLEQDPQWQPLRALHGQALEAVEPEPSSTSPGEGATAPIERFAALLDRAAERHGIALPPLAPETDTSPEVAQQQLDRFASALSAAEARLALSA